MTQNNRFLTIIFAVVVVALVAIKAGNAWRSPRSVEPIVLYQPVSHPYCTLVGEGATAFSRENGVAVRIVIGQESTQANTNSNVESLTVVGHRAFALYPIDPAGSTGLFSRLKREGCHAVAYGAEPEAGSPVAFAITTDTRRAATVAAEKLVGLLGGSGRILNVLEVLTDANTAIRRAAIEEVAGRHPGIRIIQTVGDIETEQKAREKIESALVARGDEVDGVICTGYTTTVAAAMLLSERHRRPGVKRVRFVGLDTDERVMAAIRAGLLDATVAQNPVGQGYVACALLDLLVKGWQPRSDYALIDSGCIPVTTANVDSFHDGIQAMTASIMSDLQTRYLVLPDSPGTRTAGHR